ncbi:MAG: MFS transporter [Acidobacteriia bacterium]|nr:MFS transporter [Terriglobia bacterium]
MKYRHRVLGLLFFLSIITYIDRVCISVAGPRMQKDLNMTPEQFGWVVGMFAIAYAVFEIPSGSLGDRIGPRKVLTRIVLWWSAFTSLTGAVSSFSVLLVTRFLFGAGEAGAYPNSSASISRWFPVAERGRAHGLVWMASRVGGAISPLLVVPIQIAYGWRASFFVFGILGVVWAAVWYWWFRDHPSLKPGVTPEEMKEIDTGSAPETHHGLPWGKALKSANLWWIMLMYHTYCWGSFFYLSWLHTYLAKGRGFDDQDLMRMSWLPFVFGGTANLLGGFVSDHLVKRIGLKWGRRSVGIAGLSFSAVAMFATTLTQNKLLSVVFLALGYAGSDFMLPVAWAVCLDIGRKHAGAVTGAMNTAGQIGSFLTSIAFGKIVTMYGSYDAPLIPMAVLTGVSALLWFKIDPTEQLIPEPASAAPEAPQRLAA